MKKIFAIGIINFININLSLCATDNNNQAEVDIFDNYSAGDMCVDNPDPILSKETYYLNIEESDHEECMSLDELFTLSKQSNIYSPPLIHESTSEVESIDQTPSEVESKYLSRSSSEQSNQEEKETKIYSHSAPTSSLTINDLRTYRSFMNKERCFGYHHIPSNSL